ncbi:MAG: hypothetical protein Q8Q09_00540 [Deltaproteobacteria bacterium]|nr:hypothetical protein [Deltaproteobacteria bacterium]
MLPPFIIEQIRRREEQQRQQQMEQPVLELPLPSNYPKQPKPAIEEEEPNRVVIVDL